MRNFVPSPSKIFANFQCVPHDPGVIFWKFGAISFIIRRERIFFLKTWLWKILSGCQTLKRFLLNWTFCVGLKSFWPRLIRHAGKGIIIICTYCTYTHIHIHTIHKKCFSSVHITLYVCACYCSEDKQYICLSFKMSNAWLVGIVTTKECCLSSLQWQTKYSLSTTGGSKRRQA